MQTQDARVQMIEQQVRAWDVLDARVLDVMSRMPRELFAPPEQRFLAYADVEVPLSTRPAHAAAKRRTGGCCRPCCRQPGNRCWRSARARAS